VYLICLSNTPCNRNFLFYRNNFILNQLFLITYLSWTKILNGCTNPTGTRERKVKRVINISNLPKSVVVFITILSYTANSSIKLVPVSVIPKYSLKQYLHCRKHHQKYKFMKYLVVFYRIGWLEGSIIYFSCFLLYLLQLYLFINKW